MSRGGSGRGGRSRRSGRSGKGGKSGKSSKSASKSSKSSKTSTKMTVERARAIQSHADKTGRNLDFKSRAMAAAARNEDKDD
ncbi:MAG: hypothetical protein ACTSQI_15820 [Candidatus Helarchaeota archaeon]